MVSNERDHDLSGPVHHPYCPCVSLRYQQCAVNTFVLWNGTATPNFFASTSQSSSSRGLAEATHPRYRFPLPVSVTRPPPAGPDPLLSSRLCPEDRPGVHFGATRLYHASATRWLSTPAPIIEHYWAHSITRTRKRPPSVGEGSTRATTARTRQLPAHACTAFTIALASPTRLYSSSSSSRLFSATVGCRIVTSFSV